MNLNQKDYDFINNRHAEQVLKSVMNYNVDLKMENAVELVTYEDCLNNIINSNKIELKDTNQITIPLTENQQKQIVNNAKIELDNIKLIKAYSKKN